MAVSLGSASLRLAGPPVLRRHQPRGDATRPARPRPVGARDQAHAARGQVPVDLAPFGLGVGQDAPQRAVRRLERLPGDFAGDAVTMPEVLAFFVLVIAGSEGGSFLHTIEPSVMYEYVPGSSQSQIAQIDQVDDIITVGEFYHLAVGGQIIFT